MGAISTISLANAGDAISWVILGITAWFLFFGLVWGFKRGVLRSILRLLTLGAGFAAAWFGKDVYVSAVMDAEMDGIEAEAERLMSMGLHGIKLHPDTQLFDIDDKRMYPVYEMIEGKIPLMVHSGDYRYSYSHPERLRRVMKAFPRLITIAAHFGGWSMPDEGVKQLSDMENCFVDISSSFDRISLEKGAELVSLFGEDRVLFASDFPLGSPTVERENLMRMKLSDDVREKIAYKNAEKLLGF